MKILYTVAIAWCLAGLSLFAEPYPEYDVSDIMTIPADSLAAGSLRSPLLGDTVWITGIVAVPTVVDPLQDRNPVMWASRRWVSFLRDTDVSKSDYTGINILQGDTSDAVNTLFDRVRPGNVIKALVRVSNFPSGPLGATQVEIITSESIEFLDDATLPATIPSVNISDFYTGPVANQTPNFDMGSKYVGSKVELSNVTVVAVTTFDYVLADADGNEMYFRSQSSYFTKKTETGTKPKLRPDFEGFKVGQVFKKVRGFITSSNTPGGPASFMITPATPDDVEISDILPLEIISVERDFDKPFPSPQEAVDIITRIQPGSADIAKVEVLYSVDGGAEQSVEAEELPTGSVMYKGIIPAQAANAVVRYKVTVTEDGGKQYTYPLTGDFAYRVLDRPATIADIRDPLMPRGSSAYVGFTATVEGVVTTDPTDITGSSFTRMYIQDGTNPYSGLYIVTTSPNDAIRSAQRGDKVRLTGTVAERGVRAQDYHITALENITATSTLSQGNTVDPIVLSTDVFSRKSFGDAEAEQWESMVVEFRNVVVADTNADSGGNFGEFYATDEGTTASMRVETEDSNISITNRPDQVEQGKKLIAINDKFAFLRGIMFYSFGNYKLIPRNDQDFNIVTSVEYTPLADIDAGVRAFPNPMSTETTVEFMVQSFVQEAHIRLVDMQGNTVYTATEHNLAAGNYRFTLNASVLAAGVYTCTVSTGSNSVSTHIVVVR